MTANPSAKQRAAHWTLLLLLVNLATIGVAALYHSAPPHLLADIGFRLGLVALTTLTVVLLLPCVLFWAVLGADVPPLEDLYVR